MGRWSSRTIALAIHLEEEEKKYHFDIHICNVLNCYNSRKPPKVSNVEDTQHEQKFISNKYDYNYIMITYHHMVNYHQGIPPISVLYVSI